jgi:hypothetical protein
MDTESLRSRRLAVSILTRLLIAFVVVGVIVGAITSVDPAQSSSSKVAPALRAFWVSRTGTDVTINNLRTSATVVVSCKKGCKGSEKIKTGKQTKLKSKLLTKALSAGRAARLRVQETKTGFVGVWKLVVITRQHALRTLPSPIKVYCMAPRTKACGVKKIAKKKTGLPPVNADSSPTISGTAVPGQLLTTSKGVWTNSPTSYAYQWQRCLASNCSGISGATSNPYTVQAADVGSTIRVVITASNSFGSGSAVSSESAIVPPYNSALPALSGAARDTQTLSTDGGTWSGSPVLTYAWELCDGTAIGGATGQSYVLGSGAISYQFRVKVTATKNGVSASAYSACSATVVHAIAPISTSSPVIGKSGQWMWTYGDTWSGDPASATSYQWYYSSSLPSNPSVCDTFPSPTSVVWHAARTDVTQTVDDAPDPCWAATVTRSNSGGPGSAYSVVFKAS